MKQIKLVFVFVFVFPQKQYQGKLPSWFQCDHLLQNWDNQITSVHKNKLVFLIICKQCAFLQHKPHSSSLSSPARSYLQHCVSVLMCERYMCQGSSGLILDLILVSIHNSFFQPISETGGKKKQYSSFNTVRRRVCLHLNNQK